jgi:hypothetical protein
VRRIRALLLALVPALLALTASPAGAAPTWLAPADLLPAGHNARGPQVSIGPGGDTTAVWQISEGTGSVIEAARRPPGGPWEAALTISTPGRSSFSPQVAVDAAGDATAIWELEEGEIWVVQSASRPAGGAWGTPHDIGSAGEVVEQPPRLAVDAAGDATAVWVREEGGHSIVETASRPAGGAWGVPRPISIAAQDAVGPRLAVDAAGDAAAIWEATVGGEEVVQVSSRPAGGASPSPSPRPAKKAPSRRSGSTPPATRPRSGSGPTPATS